LPILRQGAGSISAGAEKLFPDDFLDVGTHTSAPRPADAQTVTPGQWTFLGRPRSNFVGSLKIISCSRMVAQTPPKGDRARRYSPGLAYNCRRVPRPGAFVFQPGLLPIDTSRQGNGVACTQGGQIQGILAATSQLQAITITDHAKPKSRKAAGTTCGNCRSAIDYWGGRTIPNFFPGVANWLRGAGAATAIEAATLPASRPPKLPARAAHVNDGGFLVLCRL